MVRRLFYAFLTIRYGIILKQLRTKIAILMIARNIRTIFTLSLF